MEIPSRRPMLLDGATATNLFSRGFQLSDCLEAWILEHPGDLTQLQKSYLEAGSDALYAPTFGANEASLRRFGLEAQVPEMNRRLVSLSKSICEGRPVGGNMTMTGLQLLPFGETSFMELVGIYERQAAVLKNAGVDFYAIETMTSLRHARAAVLACRDFGLPVFVTMVVDDEGRTAENNSLLSCLVTLQELGISAFGLNCSAFPADMTEFFEELAPFAKIPLIAKPACCKVDKESGAYVLPPEEFASQFLPLFRAGVTIAGGCCGTTPEHIRQLRKVMDSFDFDRVSVEPHSRELVLTNEYDTFCFDLDMLEFTETIRPSADMSDEFMKIEDDSADVISIQVDTPEDAREFALNAHMAALPVCFYSESEIALKAALLLYCGRAIVDSKSDIEPETLKKIASKYGAVVY